MLKAPTNRVLTPSPRHALTRAFRPLNPSATWADGSSEGGGLVWGLHVALTRPRTAGARSPRRSLSEPSPVRPVQSSETWAHNRASSLTPHRFSFGHRLLAHSMLMPTLGRAETL